jgi:hypothetical protein
MPIVGRPNMGSFPKPQSIPRRIVMNLRFVTRKVHAYLDYPVAVSLMALPFVLGLGVSNPLAKWLSVVTGVAAFVLTVLTNHELGIIKVLPFRFHLAVDRMVGVTFVLAPIVLGFAGLDAAYYWANAAALLAVTFLFNSSERATLSSQPASIGVAKTSVMTQG